MTSIQKKNEVVRNDKISSNHPVIMTIPDELWNEFKKILPKEKPSKTVGRPVVPYRKVFDKILHVLRTGQVPMEDASQRIWLWFYLSS